MLKKNLYIRFSSEILKGNVSLNFWWWLYVLPQHLATVLYCAKLIRILSFKKIMSQLDSLCPGTHPPSTVPLYCIHYCLQVHYGWKEHNSKCQCIKKPHKIKFKKRKWIWIRAMTQMWHHCDTHRHTDKGFPSELYLLKRQLNNIRGVRAALWKYLHHLWDCLYFLLARCD